MQFENSMLPQYLEKLENKLIQCIEDDISNEEKSLSKENATEAIACALEIINEANSQIKDGVKSGQRTT